MCVCVCVFHSKCIAHKRAYVRLLNYYRHVFHDALQTINSKQKQNDMLSQFHSCTSWLVLYMLESLKNIYTVTINYNTHSKIQLLQDHYETLHVVTSHTHTPSPLHRYTPSHPHTSSSEYTPSHTSVAMVARR